MATAELIPVVEGYHRRARWSQGGTWPRERIEEAIRDWAALFGEPPRSSEWTPAPARGGGHVGLAARRWRNEHPRWPSRGTVCHAFGTWNAALRAAGFRPHREVQRARHRAQRVADAKRLSAQGLRTAHIAALLGVSSRTVGRYLRATGCSACGDPVIGDGRLCATCIIRGHRRASWSRSEVIAALRAWNAETGRPPRQGEWTPTDDRGTKWAAEYPRWPSYTMVRTAFGSWSEALRAAGFSPLRRGWDAESILEAFQAWEARYGRAPTRCDLEAPGNGLPRYATLRRHFPSYAACLAAAGVQPPARGWSDEAILGALAGFATRHGRFPRTREWERATPDHPHAATIRARFGTWTRATALAAARVEVHQDLVPHT